MNADRPDHQPEALASSAPEPTDAKPSDAEIAAKGQAETDSVHAAQAVKEAEVADLEPMLDFVLDRSDMEAGTCFGVDIPEGWLPVEVAQILCKMKAEKGLPVEKMPGAFLAKFLIEEIANSVTGTENAADAETESAKEESEAGYQSLLRSPEYQNASNTDKVALMVSHEAVPESEKAKWRPFAKILSIADQHPEDAPIVRDRFNQLDLSQGPPNHVSFIQTAIFSSPEHDSGVGEAMQQAVAAEFKLTPRRVLTGSDFEGAMAETTIDAEGNEVPVYSEDEPLKFGLGLAGYPSPDGEQEFMQATPTHGHPITLDVTKMSPAAKAVAASYLGMWKAAEDAGETDFLLNVTQFDIRGQTVLDEASLYRAARIANYTFGGRAGYNGEIVRGNDAVGLIRWQAQLRSPKGDAGRSDRNASNTRANMQGLGIMDAEGKLDEDVLKAFGDYSRDNWFGAPEYEDVQAHLRRLFPEKFEG